MTSTYSSKLPNARLLSSESVGSESHTSKKHPEVVGKDVQGLLHFYSPPSNASEPFFKVTDPSGAGQKNYGHDPRLVLIRDIRGREHEFTLSQHSFSAVTGINSSGINFSDGDEIHQQYGSMLKGLLLRHIFGSHKVVIFVLQPETLPQPRSCCVLYARFTLNNRIREPGTVSNAIFCLTRQKVLLPGIFARES